MPFSELADYRPWDAKRVPLMKPDGARAPLAKFDGQPIYRSEFTPKCIEKPISFKPMNQVLSSGPFKGDSSYRTDFVPQPIELKPPPEVATYQKTRVPFENMTTNRKDFTTKDWCMLLGGLKNGWYYYRFGGLYAKRIFYFAYRLLYCQF